MKPAVARIEIVTEGGWNAEPAPIAASRATGDSASKAPQVQLPESLKRPHAVLTALKRLLDQESGTEYERAFVGESLGAIEAWRGRHAVNMPGFFRPITPQRRAAILNFYENAALRMYNGFARRMAAYAQSPEPAKKRIADLFRQACDSKTS